MNLHPWLAMWDDSPWTVLVVAGLAVGVALLVHRLGGLVLLRVTRSMPIANEVARRCWRPAGFALALVALWVVWEAAPDKLLLIEKVRRANGLLLLATVTWLLLRAVSGVARGIATRFPVDVEDNLNARRVLTQTQLLARLVSVMVLVAGVSLMLMTFPGARQVGASLLASAGVIGIVAGIAARPVLSNLIAGLQLALAQPLRIDDVLIIQGEWGRVEEITGTYVVLKIWDERRLIIPLQWFIENSFQNWTRSSAQIIGTVLLWVDYRMPLQALRDAALAACEAADEWDQRLCLLQVVEAGERGMQLRVLVTSANATLNWDLRCIVREALVGMMQREYPQFLPTARVEVASANPADPAVSQPPRPQHP